MLLRVNHVAIDFSFLATFVYAKCNSELRKQLWAGLLRTKTDTEPWMCIGDFNVISNMEEQLGCISIRPSDLDEFNKALEESGLSDAGYTGSIYTWTNGRVLKRLDRMVHNEQWTERFTSTAVKHIAKIKSDHAPMVVSVAHRNEAKRGSFKFLDTWLTHEGLRAVVEQNWKEPMYGGGINRFWFKLKRLKECLKTWNKETFGNIFSAVAKSEEKVHHLETIFESSQAVQDRINLSEAKAEYLRNVNREEKYWEQISGIKWAAKGDRCSRFFHSHAKKKRRKYYIHGIMAEEGWTADPAEVKAGAVDFFTATYQVEQQVSDQIPSIGQ